MVQDKVKKQDKMIKVYIKDTLDKGRGVFAAKDIKKGDIIEICPLIVLPEKDDPYIEKSNLSAYWLRWGEDGKKIAIMLGFGSIYNHAYKPNSELCEDFEKDVITFIALQDIAKDEEITYNYYAGYDDPMEPVELIKDPKSENPEWFFLHPKK